MITTSRLHPSLKISKGNLYSTIDPKPGERIMIIGCSEMLIARCLDSGASTVPVLSFSQAETGQFDKVASLLTIHQYDDGAQWPAAAYQSLKKGGLFVADFAEIKALPSMIDYPYAESMAGCFERLKTAGFSFISCQQLTAQTPQEAVQNGWTELLSSNYPITVNRFVAVK